MKRQAYKHHSVLVYSKVFCVKCNKRSCWDPVMVMEHIFPCSNFINNWDYGYWTVVIRRLGITFFINGSYSTNFRNVRKCQVGLHKLMILDRGKVMVLSKINFMKMISVASIRRSNKFLNFIVGTMIFNSWERVARFLKVFVVPHTYMADVYCKYLFQWWKSERAIYSFSKISSILTSRIVHLS